MKLYSVPASPPGRVVLLTLEALGLEYEVVHLDMAKGEHKSPEFLKVNPQGQIPALVDEDFTVTQSNAIAQYLCNKYGPTSKNKNLYPNDLRVRTRIDELLFLDCDNKTSVLEYMNIPAILRGGATGINEAYLEKVKGALDAYERILSQQDYLASKEVTLADFSVLVNIGMLDLIDFDLSPYPGILKWKKRMSELPYYNDAYVQGHEVLKGVYHSYVQKNTEKNKTDDN